MKSYCFVVVVVVVFSELNLATCKIIIHIKNCCEMSAFLLFKHHSFSEADFFLHAAYFRQTCDSSTGWDLGYAAGDCPHGCAVLAAYP